jgi:mitochondrial fission protein ELM1
MRDTAAVRPFPSQWTASARQPKVWLLLGNRLGDNNQLFALAEALGFPFEAKELVYNQLKHFPLLHGSGLATLNRASRQLIAPPWPDLVIAVGYASVAVARHIRRESGGRTKIVHIGNPRTKIDDFDLQITTPQYARASARNMLELPFPIGNPARAARPTGEERQWLGAYPAPRRLVAVGGPARHWRVDRSALTHAIRILRDRTQAGSIIVATSTRTDEGTRDLLERSMKGTNEAVVEQFPRFAVLLAEADEIHVTADSVSMVSEAVLTGKPVGIIPIRRSLRGRIAKWLWERPFGRATLPNFPNFWNLLHARQLVGTVELPVANRVCDTVETAAAAVRSLLAPGDAVDEERPERSVTHLGSARRAPGR